MAAVITAGLHRNTRNYVRGMMVVVPAAAAATAGVTMTMTWDVNYVGGLAIVIATRGILRRVVTMAMAMGAGGINNGLRVVGDL